MDTIVAFRDPKEQSEAIRFDWRIAPGRRFAWHNRFVDHSFRLLLLADDSEA
jgi:hypothetical protein